MELSTSSIPPILRNAAWIACVSAALIGCGKPDADAAKADRPATVEAAKPAAKASVDVCALVPKDAVGAVIGQPIVNVVPGKGSCKYETEDAGASSVEIVVSRDDPAGQMDVVRKAAGALGSMGAAMESGKGATADVGQMVQGSGDLAGIGEQAFFDSNSTLHLLHKGLYLSVMPPIMKSRMGPGNPLLSKEDRRAMAKALAVKLLVAV
jgi:hypothetical protein